MEACHYGLDNLCGIVDKNRLQIDGCVDDVMCIDPLAEKYRAFGWHVIEIDGHNMEEILGAFKEARETKGKPTLIIAHTTKGFTRFGKSLSSPRFWCMAPSSVSPLLG